MLQLKFARICHWYNHRKRYLIYFVLLNVILYFLHINIHELHEHCLFASSYENKQSNVIFRVQQMTKDVEVITHDLNKLSNDWLCEEQYDLLIMVHTISTNIQKRNLIRRTWNNNSLPRSKMKWKTIFVSGISAGDDSLSSEQYHYSDILQLNVPEIYRKRHKISQFRNEIVILAV